jgi:phage terminase small subunit
MTKLTPKQLKFIDEYLIDMNATAAAERAGYSKKTAYSQGQRLLKNVEVAAAIKDEQNKMSIVAKLTRDDIADNLAMVIQKFLLDGYNTSQALRAIEIYNRMHGYNEPDKSEIVHKGITINYTKPNDKSGD